MKAIILTISAGGGHNTAAKAISECLNQRGIEVVIIDAYKYFNKYLSDTVEKGYLLSTKYVPKLYGRVYRIAEKKADTDIKFKLGAFGSVLVFRKLGGMRKTYPPSDVLTSWRERIPSVGILVPNLPVRAVDD